MKRLSLPVAILWVLSTCGCSAPFQSRSRAAEQAPVAISANPIKVSPADTIRASEDPCSKMFSNLFVEVDSISYNKFEVVRLNKTVQSEEFSIRIPVNYAVLKSGRKTLAVFDGVYFGAGNAADFGLASLLGSETKQLLVSLTGPRGGRHWIVDISADGATLFDSRDWDEGNEDVCIHDFDDDGVQEISLSITRFWGFGAMSMAESPLPSMVFKYDAKVRKYLPDKAASAGNLDNIEADLKTVDPDEDPRLGMKGPYLATRLDIFLRYIYAGREVDGWTFFDKTYNLKDKEDVKRKIKVALSNEPVYRFIYGMRRLKGN